MSKQERGEFFTCGNCLGFSTCRSGDNPVEKGDRAAGCMDFEPKRGYKFRFFTSETRQEQDEPFLLFIDPIDEKHVVWWVDYEVGKRQVPRNKATVDFWTSSHKLKQMAHLIATATEGADGKFVLAELRRIAKDIDRQGGIAPSAGNTDKETVIQTSRFVDANCKLYEQIIVPKDERCSFVDVNGKRYQSIKVLGGKIVPIPYGDEALQEGAVLLPTDAADYGTLEELAEDIREHIHTYLDISEEFEQFAVWYILLSWVYDRINTMPYLRALGDSGTGKSRLLDVVGRLCYKPLIVSGAVTPAPIYRMIRKWGGTLILDEADLRKSDEKNEVVTILNCGFERGRPVIRSQKDNPDDLQILPTYSPKVFATRKRFQDPALESRCLTEIMRETDRDDLPYLLPEKFYRKEMELRNKLLTFRLRNWDKIDTEKAHGLDLGDVEPRLKQTMASFAVLFANIDGVMATFRGFLKRYQVDLIEERANSYDGMLVNALFDLIDERAYTPPSQSVTNVTDVTNVTPTDVAVTSTDLAERMNQLYDVDSNCRTVGRHLKGLGLETEPRKAGGKTKRCVVLDPARLVKLRRRYVPPVDDVTANREEVTKVTKVTKVTESEGGVCAQDSNGDVTNETNVTGEPNSIVQDVTAGAHTPPSQSVTNVTDVTNVTPTDVAVTSTDLAERMNQLYDVDSNCRTVGRHLKGLGLETEPRKAGGKTKRCVVLDPARLVKLRRRYVPPVDDVTANREEVTKVTKVTKVTESEGGVCAQDSNGDVTNETNVTGEPNSIVQDVTAGAHTPPSQSVTNVTNVTDVTGFITLTEDLMAEYPAREWTVEDIARALEYDVGYVRARLEDLTASPSNPTRIRARHNGTYVLLQKKENRK